MTSAPIAEPVDVLIIGGSATGLSAALALGRSRRRVVVVDDGHPRNASTPHMHGVLGHDGLSPAEFLGKGRRDLEPYDVTFVEGRAANAQVDDTGSVQVTLDSGQTHRARALLVATGLRDELPDIPGLRERWGIDVLHCAYCHGWEVRDQRIVILSTSPISVHQALVFRQLSVDVTLVVHVGDAPGPEDLTKLNAQGVAVVPGPATEVLVEDDRLTGLQLSGGETVAAQAVVVMPRVEASSEVLDSLGLQATPHPMGPQIGTAYAVEPGGRTTVPGVWAAGNVVDPMGAVAKSVADGYGTGAMINADLVMQDAAIAACPQQPAGEGHEGHLAHTGEVPVFDQAFWDKHYSSAERVWSGQPNPHLVSEIRRLGMVPGRALDIGAGEGADAIWLAQHGWQVEAIDISPLALARGQAQSEAVLPSGIDLITWTHADLLSHRLEPSAFDLVSMQFMQLPPTDWDRLFRECRTAVAPGGALLIVGHHPEDIKARGLDAAFLSMFYTADQVAEALDETWTVQVQETRQRDVTAEDGSVMTLRDTVVLARQI